MDGSWKGSYCDTFHLILKVMGCLKAKRASSPPARFRPAVFLLSLSLLHLNTSQTFSETRPKSSLPPWLASLQTNLLDANRRCLPVSVAPWRPVVRHQSRSPTGFTAVSLRPDQGHCFLIGRRYSPLLGAASSSTHSAAAVTPVFAACVTAVCSSVILSDISEGLCGVSHPNFTALQFCK